MNEFPGASLILSGLFGAIVCLTISGALIAVLSARLVRSVCGLAICSIGLAGLYYFLRSPFLALMEILIYIGAVCVTIVFAVMLAEPDEAPRQETSGGRLLWGGAALVASGAVFLGITQLSLGHPWVLVSPRTGDGSIKSIGASLLTTYSLPFELISLVLLVAIVGAIVVARPGRKKT